MNTRLLQKHYMVQSKLLKSFTEVFHIFPNRYDWQYCAHSQNEQYPWKMVEQIHGKKIIEIAREKNFKTKGYDGMVTEMKECPMGIKTADCVPVFFFSPDIHLLLGVHAGWKGLYDGIIDSALDVITQKQGNISTVIVAIGPHIGKCCYSVQKERVDLFTEKMASPKASILKDTIWFLDLSEIIKSTLKKRNIKDSHIDDVDICTYCHEEYFSFRREGASCGRMINVVGLVS